MKVQATILVCVVSLASFGCVSNSQRPVGEIATAKASITLAEQSGAQSHSVEYLTTAQQKIDRATTLADSGEAESARRLANEADIDARVAAAKAQLWKSKESVNEINATLDTLESELNRGE